jgi:pimeloyl-ACP methyl ester carboxylesterase
MPDLRAHGSSAKPHDAASYPPDVLPRDGLALIAHLGLTDYDLGGYSLGARTTVRMLVSGATPRRAVICGMGLDGLTDTMRRAEHFRDILTNLGSFERGSEKWMAEAFLKTTKGDPVALLRIIDTFVDTSAAQIAAIEQPVLVLSGDRDDDNGSAEALAAALPDAIYRAVPGNHMNAVLKPELGEEIAAFLAA